MNNPQKFNDYQFPTNPQAWYWKYIWMYCWYVSEVGVLEDYSFQKTMKPCDVAPLLGKTFLKLPQTLDKREENILTGLRIVSANTDLWWDMMNKQTHLTVLIVVRCVNHFSHGVASHGPQSGFYWLNYNFWNRRRSVWLLQSVQSPLENISLCFKFPTQEF